MPIVINLYNSGVPLAHNIMVNGNCVFNPFKPSVLSLGHRQTVHPYQTLQNAASDQGLHCLLAETSIRISIKMKKKHP